MSLGQTPQQLVNAVRSKDPMHGLCESKQITPSGCDWLKFALDPFHDLQLNEMRGYPDVQTEPTVIVKVRQAAEISAPKGLSTAFPKSNWDCHIALSPIDWAKPNGLLQNTSTATTQGYNAACRFNPQGWDPTGASPNGAGWISNIGGASVPNIPYMPVTGRLDGLVINSVPAGAVDGGDLTFTPGHMPKEAGGGYATNNIVLDNYLDFGETDLGVYRVVSSGFEVVNTTAQIYKQGAVTVYEYGHSYETSQAHMQFDLIGSDTTVESMATNVFRLPPNTIAEAKIMPGSHTWPAQDGCYCTAKFLSDNPFQSATQRNYILQQNNEVGDKLSGFQSGQQPDVGSFCSPGLIGNAWPACKSAYGTVLGPGFKATPSTHFSRMSTAGAYFTGLSPETTLFVTWRVVLERLPAANKPTFLALAQPSATFDPNALALYNLIANHLPPGCPQGWNDLGKWFEMIATAARRVIPAAFPVVAAAQMMLNTLGRPQAANMLGMANSAAQQMVKSANQSAAAKKIQQAVRARATKAKPTPRPNARRAVQNFGAPGARGGRRLQQFGQMA